MPATFGRRKIADLSLQTAPYTRGFVYRRLNSAKKNEKETDQVMDFQSEKITFDFYSMFVTTANANDIRDKNKLLDIISKQHMTIEKLTTTIESLEREIRNLLTQLDF